MKIACPKCAWEPTASARWSCACGHSWNTFDTGGQCPECKKVWHDTQCLACARWSKHHDWYHDLPSVDLEFIVRQEDAPLKTDAIMADHGTFTASSCATVRDDAVHRAQGFSFTTSEIADRVTP